MIWQTRVVSANALPTFLAKIRTDGGTVTKSQPVPNGICLTWTTTTDCDLA